MDCEGFDGVALDLVDSDGRHDVRAVEDAKRHAEGCTRCATALRSLRTAREAVRLPALALPDGLEARILAAARGRERETRSGWWQRLDLFISRAGAYAMRPQPAMALVLLLMVGSSIFLLRARPDVASRVVVTERGVPIPRAAEKVDTTTESAAADAPAAAPMPAASAAPPATMLAQRDEERSIAKMEGARDSRGGDAASAKGATVEAEGPIALREFSPAPRRPAAEAAPAAAAPPPPVVALAPAATATAAAAQPQVQSAPGAGAGATTTGADATFSAAMDDFKARRFAEAQRGFDLVVNEGGAQAPLAALYAARSVRYTAGCSPAVARFDSVANRFTGTSIATEAMWDGALCYRELGQYDRSRQLFLALRRVAGYRERVDRELAELEQRPAVGGARPGTPARAAPARVGPPPNRAAAPAPPANADVDRTR